VSGHGFAAKLNDPTPAGLIDRLVIRVERLLTPSFWNNNQFAPYDGEEDFTDPHVFAQFLPIDRLWDRTGPADETGKPTDAGRDARKDRPVVRIFNDGGKMADFAKIIVTVTFVFEGWYEEPDNQGWRIPLMMMWQVLTDLCKTHKEGAYVIEPRSEPPWFKYTVGDEDAKPFWRVSMETVWTSSAPADFDMYRHSKPDISKWDTLETNRSEA